MTGLPATLRDLLFDLLFDWRIRPIKAQCGLFPLVSCNQTGAADVASCGSTHPRRPAGWTPALDDNGGSHP